MRNAKHRARRKKVCETTGKRCYLTREDAAHDMGILAKTTHTVLLCVYRCGECGEFHVGHMKKETRMQYRLGVAFNDEFFYDSLVKAQKKYPNATIAQVLDCWCLFMIDHLLPDANVASAPATLAQFEPWLSDEKKRLAWMDRTRN